MRYLPFLLFFALTSLVAEEKPIDPWYIGSLLSFNPINQAPKTLNLQPFVFAVNNYGRYDNLGNLHNQDDKGTLTLALQMETGILSWLDITVYGQLIQITGEKGSHLEIAPTQVYLGFQALREQIGTPIPSVRLIFIEVFPTGPNNMQFNTKHSVITGAHGTYLTGGVLVVDKTFYQWPRHPIDVNFNFQYMFPSEVPIKNQKLYGGQPDPTGKVQPGQAIFVDLALQYTMTQKWYLASDFVFEYTMKNRFKGTSDAPLKSHSTALVSVTPSVEYCVSKNVGTLFSLWFSIYGKDMQAFLGGAASGSITW